MAAVNFSDAALCQLGPDPASIQVHGAFADLRQGFYQMLWLEMASWFAFDFPETAATFGTN